MVTSYSSYNQTVLAHWESFIRTVQTQNHVIYVDGHSLELASVVAIARHSSVIRMHESAREPVVKSAQAVQASLERGEIIYGVNTGFGGSADTRTNAVEELQRLLTRGLHYGMLVPPYRTPVKADSDILRALASSLPLDDPLAATCMPDSWVRASMSIRLNSLSTGVSGVQVATIDCLNKLLDHDIVPRIPIRGSISASGDLSPLSYIGGVMQGKPTLTTWTGDRSAGQRRITRADIALNEAGIRPVKLGPKEGLAIVNGTAISAGVAALAMHEAHCQTILAQILTAMSVEALTGTDESFHPFFANYRPHPGQADSAFNIYAFLANSKLVHRSDGTEEASLRQDRYSIRTASQWIGPVLEDLLLAHKQVLTEINSVTDNPLVDTESGKMFHGGNFQARAITSAMEKVRQGCQTIGRMLYVQCTELINPATSRGLPPNLVVDDPSESYIWKGTDIMVAALQSELGFLASPVGTHVQTAEMGNQALNSLALISARYTLDALDVLSQISAIHLIALCQAVDLRVMNSRFLDSFHAIFLEETRNAFGSVVDNSRVLDRIQPTLWAAFKRHMDQTTGMDAGKRFTFVIDSLQPIIVQSAPCSAESLRALKSWRQSCSAAALEAFNMNRACYIARPDAAPCLGQSSRRMYKFVRETLSVPFLQESTIRTPEPELINGEMTNTQNSHSGVTDTHTVSSLMTTVYQSIKTGTLYTAVMECLRDTTI